MKNEYFFLTGEADKQRLTILNRLYNPIALQFLQDSGLKPGMTILEVGCGTGHMACDLAQVVGSQGKVIAIDSSAAQIAVAKETAKQANIKNIDFYICDVANLDQLGITYDATYGRWVLEFSENPAAAIALMYKHLNKNGILAYEASNIQQTLYFSHPHTPLIEKYHSIGSKMFSAHNCATYFAFEINQIFHELNCKNQKLKVNQAILNTAEEKSVYRFGLIAATAALLEKKIMSESEIKTLINECIAFEESNAISGFFHNILISGIK